MQWALCLGGVLALASTGHGEEAAMVTNADASTAATTGTVEVATFSAGCFWCSEAVFQQLEGVKSVRPGYTGGHTRNPTYKQVCSGKTGHAESVQIEYDPRKVSYERLLDLFWRMHDPTTPNRQGADVGTQYRSAIFYHSEAQRRTAEASREALGKSGKYAQPIVTEIVPASDFYPAEDYHQDYFKNNPNAPYCRFVIVPKLEKLGLEK